MPFSTDTKLSRYCLLLKKNPEKNKGYSSLADSIDRFDQYFLFFAYNPSWNSYLV